MLHSKIRELIDTLEMEVNNGGFDQYFFNSTGDSAKEAAEALEAIGAHNMAAIVKRAIAKFPGGEVPADRNARQAVLEEISPEREAFEELDAEFLKYPDNLAALLGGA